MQTGIKIALGMGSSPLVLLADGNFMQTGEAAFAGGTYTLNGETVTLGDIVDLTASTGFNPATDLDANGVHPHDNGAGGTQNVPFFLKDPLLSQVIGGFTSVLEADFQSEIGTTGGTTLTVGGNDPEFNFFPDLIAQWDVNSSSDHIYLDDVGGGRQNNAGLIGASGIHKIACTFTDTEMAFSIDGGAVHTYSAAGVDPAVTRWGFTIGGQIDAYLRKFAFYEPVSNASLPTLSAL